MLAIPGTVKIFCYQEGIDLRKGFEGLSHLVESAFEQEVASHAYFVFLNARRDRMKVLYWDSDGLAIWFKRLERGIFSKPGGKILLSRREFCTLLEGIIPRRTYKRYEVSGEREGVSPSLIPN
jgi:transposase